MTLKPDPLGASRLVGDNTSENVFLAPDWLRLNPLGAWMLGGNDTVFGSSDNDLIYGNEGEDLLSGEAGEDTLFGGKGKDGLSVRNGKGFLSGGEETDWLLGGNDDDVLIGGKGNDFILTGNGNDTLIGGLGRDVLFNWTREDSLGETNPGVGDKVYILQPDPSAVDLNTTDVILIFNPINDTIGLTGALTENDVSLKLIENTTLTLDIEAPQAIGNEASFPRRVEDSVWGTFIQVKSTGANLGFVFSVTPDQLRGRFVSVEEA